MFLNYMYVPTCSQQIFRQYKTTLSWPIYSFAPAPNELSCFAVVVSAVEAIVSSFKGRWELSGDPTRSPVNSRHAVNVQR